MFCDVIGCFSGVVYIIWLEWNIEGLVIRGDKLNVLDI